MLTRYNISPIAIALIVVYVASFVLYRSGRMRVTTHRKIWNVLLLGTFLTTAVFGLVLAVKRDYSLIFPLPFDLLFWHVEAGIAMAMVSLFHISWHLGYYRRLLTARREAAASEKGTRRKKAPYARIPEGGRTK